MDSAEHVEVGNSVLLKLPDGSLKPAALNPLIHVGTIALHYGDVVALGGDFYGGSGPISDLVATAERERRFWQGFEMLRSEDPAILNQILDVLQIEKDEIAKARAAQPPREPSTAYAALGDSLSFKWKDITAKRRKGLPYDQLLYVNMDHFGDDARIAYTVGHRLAMQSAAALHDRIRNPSTWQKLMEVYAANAYADHFLTDLFAAGHVRTPRRALYNLPMTFAAETGLLARAMHDEDNLYGLHVKNTRGDSWTAYGDAKILDSVNTQNKAFAIEAVQASADEVYQAALTGTVNTGTPKALDIAPRPLYSPTAPPMVQKDQNGKIISENSAPMFWAGDAETPRGIVYRRGNPNDDWRNRDNWNLSPQWSLYPMAEALLSQMLKDDYLDPLGQAVAKGLGLKP